MAETSGATATDHLWFGEDFDDLYEAYCITLVRGIAPEALLSRLGATQQIRVTGVHELIEPAYHAWDMNEDEGRGDELNTETAFALAERITGVRLTRELLETAEFTGGMAPLPSGS